MSSTHPNNLQPQRIQHHNAIFMYANISKYTRSSSQPTGTPNPHHMYSGHHYKKPLPHCVSYLPLSVAVQTHTQFPATQRPFSAAPTSVDSGPNFLSHSDGASLMYRNIRQNNRKSAVELLAESKPFYVKSDLFIERLKSSNYRSNASNSVSCGSKRGRSSLDDVTNERYNGAYSSACLQNDIDRGYMATSPLHNGNNGTRGQHFHHHHHNASGRCSSTASSSNLLQSKLRKLLTSEVTKDVCSRRFKGYRENTPSQFEHSNEIPSSGVVQEQSTSSMLLNHTFLSPQSLPLQPDVFKEFSNFTLQNCSEDPLVLTDDYRAISPPAEYAAGSNRTIRNENRSRYNYQRSYSHSNEMTMDERKDICGSKYNINSHKSLPDLHSQINRHSPHSEILSCCSRGNRSIKSIGESSLNRDSGGSSGHYTHRSEPCYKRERECIRDAYETKVMCTSICSDYRRDSGSSTQHSANSCCGYPSSSPYRNIDCPECRTKSSVTRMDSSDYLVDFTTPEVPEAFQDDYSPPSPSVTKYRHIEEKLYSNASSHQQQPAYISQQMYQQISKQEQIALLQSPGSAPSLEDLSPPPIQFKRQKCIRFKNRPRISVPNLRTTNDATNVQNMEGYRHTNVEHSAFFFPKTITSEMRSKSEQLSRRNSYQLSNEPNTPRQSSDRVIDLEKFFDRLGLNDDKFHEIYSLPKRRQCAETDSDESSTVFFSDVSTVDSMRLPDSTETQSQITQAYRTTEPPSIVERNARIIKWLCNCRKMQYT